MTTMINGKEYDDDIASSSMSENLKDMEQYEREVWRRHEAEEKKRLADEDANQGYASSGSSFSFSRSEELV